MRSALIAGIPLCERHRAAVVQEAVEGSSLLDGRSPDPCWVYYLGDPPSQTVKIGATKNLKSRISTFRCHLPQVRLLAVEPGYIYTEQKRHATFADLRILNAAHAGYDGSTEWFRKDVRLMDHISRLRRRFGDPADVLDVKCRCQLPAAMAAIPSHI